MAPRTPQISCMSDNDKLSDFGLGQMGELMALAFGVPFTTDNEDGTYTHTFAPGEDDILNATYLKESE